MYFRATAYNDKGYTFGFFFQNTNWGEIEKAAQEKLDKVVAADTLHQKLGPWSFRNIDVSA